MESFEIKDLFAIHGKSGLFRFKARLKNGGNLFVRLIDEKQKVIMMSKDNGKLMHFENIGVYIKDQEDPIKLESVLETLYEMSDKDIEIPSNLVTLGDRWETVETFMSEVIPNYDDTKFKPHHMDKILKWYHEFVTGLDMLDADLDAEDERPPAPGEHVIVNQEVADQLKELTDKGPKNK